MYFEGPETISSKKCKYPPGGESKFQFLYNNAHIDKCNFNKYPDTKTNYNIITMQDTKENCGIIGKKNRKRKAESGDQRWYRKHEIALGRLLARHWGNHLYPRRH